MVTCGHGNGVQHMICALSTRQTDGIHATRNHKHIFLTYHFLFFFVKMVNVFLELVFPMHAIDERSDENTRSIRITNQNNKR